MIEDIARRLAYRAAQINGDPLLTGEADHWFSLPGQAQRAWRWAAAEAVKMAEGGGL